MVIRHSAFGIPRSPSLNPEPRTLNSFPLPPRGTRAAGRFRLGITLTEVLISLGILTIGLLGVAAIFPVGSYYLQKGEISDRGSAIAQAAFNDLESRGALNPANWLMLRGSGGTPPYWWPYTQNFTQRLAAVLASTTGQTTQLRTLNAQVGYAFVIDPLGINGSGLPTAALADPKRFLLTQQFPFNAQMGAYSLNSWAPWRWSSPSSVSSVTTDPRWPIVRVTLPQAGTGSALIPMGDSFADEVFRSKDDLALDVPNKASQPSTQLWETVKNGTQEIPLTRKSRGDYTWMATIVPSSSDARNALASNPTAFEYEVSVAVSYKRAIDNVFDFFKNGGSPPAERLVNAQVVSTGLNGGQLLLTQLSTDTDPNTNLPTADPFGALKAGNWVVVCGPHPASTDNLNRFVLRWYRVLAIEGKDTKLDSYGRPTTATSQPQRRLVSLRGPQWPWQPASDLSDYNNLSNYICVAIIPSVVAVHSKSIRLEGISAWSIQ